MRITRNRSAAVLLAAATVGLLASCSSTTTADPAPATTGAAKSITIGFSPENQSDPTFIGLTKGVQGYAASKGNKVLVADPKNSAATQVQQVKSWIENGQVQAVWFLAVSAPSMKQVIKAAQAKHVVVVAGGAPSDYGFPGPLPGVSFSTLDYAKYGGTLGEQAGQCSKKRLNGKAQALLITTPPGSTGAQGTTDAMKKALAKSDPDAKIVATVPGNNERLTAQTNTSSALQAHPDINMILSINDEQTLGAIKALQAAGKDVSKLCVLDAGGGVEALAAVKAGQIYSISALDFTGDLTQTADLLQKMAADPTAKGIVHTVPVKVSAQ